MVDLAGRKAVSNVLIEVTALGVGRKQGAIYIGHRGNRKPSHCEIPVAAGCVQGGNKPRPGSSILERHGGQPFPVEIVPKFHLKQICQLMFWNELSLL